MGNKITSFGVRKNATTEEVVEGINLEGKNFVITGTSDGLGKECARVLYKKGCNLFVLNRNEKKAEKVNNKIIKDNPNSKGKFYSFTCDLASQKSVKNAVKKLIEKHADMKIDVLLCNAGICSPHEITEDGFETTMAVCHFGHFTLILSLLTKMNENSRIHIVSSIVHKMYRYFKVNVALDFNDMHFKRRKYSYEQAYGHAKLANLYLALELDRLLKKSKKKIICHASHPGGASTNFGNDFGKVKFSVRCQLCFQHFLGLMKNVKYGATGQLLACTHPKANIGGRYISNHNEYEEPSDLAKDEKIAKKFFKMSLKDTGMKWPWKVDGEDINDLRDVKGSK